MTRKTALIFRPAALPKVSHVQFEGNRLVSAATLRTALEHLVLGNEFSQREFRNIVELNLRPIYEEKAMLTVAFPSIKITAASAGEVDVTVEINEGPCYSLGKVEVSGEDPPVDSMLRAARFPEQKPANWKQVMAGIGEMERVLKTDGYLAVASKPEKSFHNDSPIVDLTIRVTKGKQFFFGLLQISRLDDAAQTLAVKMWKLRESEPMNEPYVAEYLRNLFRALNGGPKSVSQQLRPRAGSNIVDVALIFR